MVERSGDPLVVGRDIWKIFGNNAAAAMAAVRGGASKEDIRDGKLGIVGVAGVNFEVMRDELFCIMGLSGSGKSTLIRHINRLIEPTAGTILIDGQDIGALSHRDLLHLRAERVSMVFQNMALFPHRSVLENVCFGLEVRGLPKAQRREKAYHVLEQVELAGWAQHYPDALSGGMRQRVGLARALATDPEILLMDEPFSALDPLIRRQLQDEFIRLTRQLGKTVIFITHDLDEAIRIGDRIAIMKEGRFVQVGTPEAIVTGPADDYVADFVRGISRLKLVRAHSVMRPVEHFRREAPEVEVAGLRKVDVDADLESLIDLKAARLEPVAVMNGGLHPVGVVTIADLLNGLRGAGEAANRPDDAHN